MTTDIEEKLEKLKSRRSLLDADPEGDELDLLAYEVAIEALSRIEQDHIVEANKMIEPVVEGDALSANNIKSAIGDVKYVQERWKHSPNKCDLGEDTIQTIRRSSILCTDDRAWCPVQHN